MAIEILSALDIAPGTLVESHRVWPVDGVYQVQTPINTEFKFDSSVDFTGTTSNTSNSISPSALKTFTVASGLSIPIGLKVKVADVNNPEVNWMSGFVSSYVGTSLRVAITDKGGSGTYSSWSISQFYDEPWCSTYNLPFSSVTVSGPFKLRATSSGSYSGSVSAGITIYDENEYSWGIETRSADYVEHVPSTDLPFPSSFGTATGYISTVTESQKASFDPAPTAIVSCPPGVEFSFNNGRWESSPQYWGFATFIKARFLSSPSYNTQLSKDICIDGTDSPYAVLTGPRKEIVVPARRTGLSKRVIYTKANIKQVVSLIEPKPPKEIDYEFSNGRKFYKKEGT